MEQNARFSYYARSVLPVILICLHTSHNIAEIAEGGQHDGRKPYLATRHLFG